jgi:hypothetical protein
MNSEDSDHVQWNVSEGFGNVKKEWGISSAAFIRKPFDHLRDKQNCGLKPIVCLVKKKMIAIKYYVFSFI